MGHKTRGGRDDLFSHPWRVAAESTIGSINWSGTIAVGQTG